MSQFGVMLLTFAGVIGLVGLIKFLSWLTLLQEQGGIGTAIRRGASRYVVRRESVRHYPASIMSSDEIAPAQTSAPSLQTRPPQTPDRTEDPAARRKKLLDTYTPLKHLGMNRDDARALLKIWDIPLDNNLWAQVPAKPETEYTTPIAGRPTAAQFEADPELTYNPPPR